MRHQTSEIPLRPPSAPGASRPTVVIVDGGDRAGVVVLDPGATTAVGTRFDHQGRRWEIRGRRSFSRVLVAEPVADGRHRA